MSCIITTGTSLDCWGTGGLQEMHIANYDGSATFDVDVNDEITGVTTTSTYFEIELDQDFGGLSQDVAGDATNASVVITSTLDIKVARVDKSKLKLMRELTKAPIQALIKDNNGVWYFVGKEKALRVLTGTAGLGTAQTDFNGLELQAVSTSPNGVYVVSEAAALSVLAP